MPSTLDSPRALSQVGDTVPTSDDKSAGVSLVSIARPGHGASARTDSAIPAPVKGSLRGGVSPEQMYAYLHASVQ